MIAAETLLDAFINANILFCVTFALWFLLRKVMGAFGIAHAHGAHLKLLNTIFVVVITAPIIAACFNGLQSAGVASEVNVNLSDLIVSHYLQGAFDMKASRLEGLILARDTFMINVMAGSGWLPRLIITMFAIGLCLGTFRLVLSGFCLRRIVLGSYKWRSLGRVDIRLSDTTMVPFSTRGFLRYHVVLPSHMLAQPAQLKVSLAHEFQHIRQGDLEWEILLEGLKPFFYLNPAFHAWKRHVEELREFSCDSAVLSRGYIDVHAYCDTLISVCQKSLKCTQPVNTAVPKVTLVAPGRSKGSDHRVSFVEHRILTVLDMGKHVNQRVIFRAIAAPILICVVLVALSIQRPGDWSQDRLTLSTVVNLERLAEINRTAAFGHAGN
ncbi:MAG: M56 family metallopeptidase [Roseobacter sp.]